MANLEQHWSLRLLGCWQLRYAGAPVEVGARQQRVITILALLGTHSRRSIATRLWPDSSSARTGANLRASLIRISHEQPGLIRGSADTIALEPSVGVDVAALRLAIGDMLGARGGALLAAVVADLSAAELLPGWADDWVASEQERFDQQRLCALETAARSCLQNGELDRAVELATAAIDIAPLRESTYLLLMRAHLAAGNRALANQVHQRLSWVLFTELGIGPSAELDELIAPGLAAMRQPVTPR